jgi:hypothetical protein
MNDIVKFLRGVNSKYSPTTMSDGVYFSTDTNTILMGNNEYGSFPKDFKIYSGGDDVDTKIICENVNLNLSPYSVNTDINFANGEYIQIDIDLSNCSQSHLIELVALGNSITSLSANTLRVNCMYGGPSTFSLIFQYINQQSESKATVKSINANKMSLKICSDGVFVDGTIISMFTETMLSPFFALTNINIGSTRTDNTSFLSDATYTKIARGITLGGTNPYIAYRPNEETLQFNEITSLSVNCGEY